MSTKTPEMFSREVPVTSLDAVVESAKNAESSKEHSVKVEAAIDAGESILMAGAIESPDRLGVFSVGEGVDAKPFELISLEGKDKVVDPSDPLKAKVEIDGVSYDVTPDSTVLIVGLDASSTPDKPVKFGMGLSDGATKIATKYPSGDATPFAERFGLDAAAGDIVDLTIDSGKVIANAHTKLEVVTHKAETDAERAERVRIAGEEAGRVIVEEALGMLDGTRSVIRATKRDAREAFLKHQAEIREAERPTLLDGLRGAKASLEGAEAVLDSAKMDAGRKNRRKEAASIKERLDEAVRNRAEAERAAGKVVSDRSVRKQLKGTRGVAKRMARVQAATRLSNAREGLTTARTNYDSARDSLQTNSSNSSRGGRGTRFEARRAVKELTHEERSELLNSNTTDERRREIIAKGQKEVANTGIRQRSYNAISSVDTRIQKTGDWSTLLTTRIGEKYHNSRGKASRRQRNAAARAKATRK